MTLTTIVIACCIKHAKRDGYIEIVSDMSESYEIEAKKNETTT